MSEAANSPSPAPGTGRRRWLRWVIAVVVVVAVVAVGGPFVFIHFIEGPPAPRLVLPKAGTTSGTGAGATASGIGGTWKVSAGSSAGYRVQEVLLGQSTTAVGRTSQVTGQVEIGGTTVEHASFTVDMASVVSNQPQRNAQFDGRIMDVLRYPTATFQLTHPIPLGPLPAVGDTVHVTATGALTLHGVTRTVAVPLSAERLATSIDVLGDTDLVFSDWGIDNPSIAGFVTTADHGTLEVLLHLTRG